VKIKLVNPNTTASMTAMLGVCARRVVAVGTEILETNPAMGPPSIESWYDEAMAVPGLLAEITAGERTGCDGYVIACFGDPGLLAAREIARGPVLGIAEAAMHVASMIAPNFSVVTTMARTRGMAWALAERYGMQRFCRSVRATEIPVLDLALPGSAARRQIVDECRRAMEIDGAESIVLGCAGMADLCADMSATLGVPVIDGVTAAVKMVEAMVGLGVVTAKRGEFAYPAAKTYTGVFAAQSPAERTARPPKRAVASAMVAPSFAGTEAGANPPRTASKTASTINVEA
jgi:allantoin racemase